MGVVFSRIEHVRTADEVVQQIENLILEGVLRVADRLPAERELARQFEQTEKVRIAISQGGSEDLYQSARRSRLGDIYFPGEPSYRARHLDEGLLGYYKLVGYNMITAKKFLFRFPIFRQSRRCLPVSQDALYLIDVVDVQRPQPDHFDIIHLNRIPLKRLSENTTSYFTCHSRVSPVIPAKAGIHPK